MRVFMMVIQIYFRRWSMFLKIAKLCLKLTENCYLKMVYLDKAQVLELK